MHDVLLLSVVCPGAMHCKASLPNSTSDSDLVRFRMVNTSPLASHKLIEFKPDPLVTLPSSEIDIIAPCKLIDRTHNVTEKVTQVSKKTLSWN